MDFISDYTRILDNFLIQNSNLPWVIARILHVEDLQGFFMLKICSGDRRHESNRVEKGKEEIIDQFISSHILDSRNLYKNSYKELNFYNYY